MYLNNEIYSTKLQRSVIRKYDRYHMSQHTPHNRVGLHKIQQWCCDQGKYLAKNNDRFGKSIFLEQNRSHFYTDIHRSTEVGAVFSVFEKVYPFDQSQLL